MKSIGFKNFRKFENFPSIKLGDVTYLVGQNNAGKSTMVKAAILLLENLKKKDQVPFADNAYFSFSTSTHDLHVDTFKRALRNGSNDKKIYLSTTLGDFNFEIIVKPADDSELYGFIQTDNDRKAPIETLIVTDNKLGIRIEIHPFAHQYILEFDDLKYSPYQKTLDSIEDINLSIEKLKNDLKYSPYQKTLDSIEDINLRIEKLKNDLITSPKLKYVYSDYLKKRFFLVKLEEELRDLIRKLEYQHRLFCKKNNEDTKTQLKFSMLLTYNDNYRSMNLIAREIYAITNLAQNYCLNEKICETFNKNLNEKEIEVQKLNLKVLNDYGDLLKDMWSRLNATLESIDVMYIPVHLAAQDMVLNAHTGDVFAKVVDLYQHGTKVFDRDKSIYQFIKKWMDKEHFNIGKGFKIEEKLPGYYTLIINTFDNGFVPVGDMGMGSSQLMILLLHIANKMRWARVVKTDDAKESDEPWLYPIFFLEEPELNLHPKLQSKLADLFYELATGDDYRMQFVIETHSEYIIRKAQVIVAEANYKDDSDLEENNPIEVYYFPSDGLPYNMGFKTTGRFKNVFDNGFFDVAANLNLITLKKERGVK